MLVAFNYRINKRQAYRLYLETRVGDFELTAPKVREDILESKNILDNLLKLNGAWNEWKTNGFFLTRDLYKLFRG